MRNVMSGRLGRIPSSVRARLASSRPSRAAAVLATGLLTASFVTACNDDDVVKSTGVVAGRIATMNVCNPCGGRSVSSLGNVIAGIRPEAIGLQEACGDEVHEVASNLRKKHLNYRIVDGPTRTLKSTYRCSGDLSFGNYLLAASGVTKEGHTNYDAEGTEKRGYAWAYTSLHGVETRLVVTHLPEASQAAVRTANVKQLDRSVAPWPHDDRPTVIVGDFNAQPFDPGLKPLWGPWRDADPNCSSKPSAYRCKGTQLGKFGKDGTGKKFDYIWLDRRAKTRPSRINVKAAYTDHSLVYADLSPSDLTPAPPPPPQITERNCSEKPTNDPCLHTDTLAGDISPSGQGHGFYVAPSHMYVGSNLAISGLEWKSWGRPSARGEGWTASNDCDPTCAEGKPVRIKVEVEASTERDVDGMRRYTCARARKAGKSWDSLGIHGKVCV